MQSKDESPHAAQCSPDTSTRPASNASPPQGVYLFNKTQRVGFLQRHRYYTDRIVCQSRTRSTLEEWKSRTDAAFCSAPAEVVKWRDIWFLGLSSCSCRTIRPLSCETDGLRRIYHSCHSSCSAEILFSCIVQGKQQISPQKNSAAVLVRQPLAAFLSVVFSLFPQQFDPIKLQVDIQL